MGTLDRLFARFRLFPLTHVCTVKQGICFLLQRQYIAAFLKISGLESFYQSDGFANLHVFKNIRSRQHSQNILFLSLQWERKAELDKFLSIFLFIGVIGNGA